MRHLRSLTLLPLVLAGVGACADRTISRLEPTQGKVETKDLPAVPNRDVDILFLIDNSLSMEEEQTSLRANFSKFMDVLGTIEGGMPNVHIGVATSSLGQAAGDGVGTGAFGAGCAGTGDDGNLRGAAAISGRFIIDEETPGGGARNRNYSGTLGDAFSAIADVGTGGCGIEQHLAAAERALTNPGNAGFLRPDAKLAVIFIADEDDCSLAHKALFDGATDGTVVNFRCTQDGVECDTGNPDLSVAGLREDCHPASAPAYVSDTQAYVDYFQGLKPDFEHDVIVAGIVGDPDPFAITTDDQGHPILAPSCSYSGQFAYPAVRTTDFLSQFPQSVRESICEPDLSGALVQIGALLKRSFGDPCFETQPADLDPNTPGLQAECSVTDVQRSPDGTDTELAVIPACDAAPGEIPCWRIEQDDTRCYYTASKLALVIDRGGEVPGSDIHVKASCVTTQQ
jgi:hypothetical protein